MYIHCIYVDPAIVHMKSGNLILRVETRLKRDAGAVLTRKGFNMSQAIRLFLLAVVNRRDLPFLVGHEDGIDAAHLKAGTPRPVTTFKPKPGHPSGKGKARER
jgi:addiction module RelB/DinJ family antitoxin